MGFLCENHQTEIYVNDKFVGTGHVNYTAPDGIENVVVSCKENGEEVYRRDFNIKNYRGKLIELNIPRNYRYSSGNSTEK